MGTKATRDQRVQALVAVSRSARTTAGHLEDKGRSREAAAYLDLADHLLLWARYVQANGWNTQMRLWEL